MVVVRTCGVVGDVCGGDDIFVVVVVDMTIKIAAPFNYSIDVDESENEQNHNGLLIQLKIVGHAYPLMTMRKECINSIEWLRIFSF